MTTTTTTLVLALCVGLCFVLFNKVASSEDDAPPSMPGLTDEMKARITPSKGHEKLEYFVGNWTYESKFTMPGMDKMPAEKGTEEVESVLGGRYTMSRRKGSVMGAPFEAIALTGYNNMTKSYEVVVLDNMSTDMKIGYGNVVARDGNTMASNGRMCEYMTGQTKKPWRSVTKIKDADHYTMEVWDPEIGADGMKVFELRYTRVK